MENKGTIIGSTIAGYVYGRGYQVILQTGRVDPSGLAFSLSSHRHSYKSLLFSSRFLD